MSPKGALVAALVGLMVLGGFAAWMLNVPLWPIPLVAVAGWLVGRALRRFSRSRARQDTEAPR
jgi:hypothetical protein